MLCIVGAVAAVASSEETEGATATRTSTLTFNANYPDGTTSTVSYSMIVGATIELPTQLFECDGYVLTGWGRTASGSATYDAGDSYTVTSSNVTLYAKWTDPFDYDGRYYYFAEDVTSTATTDSVYTFTVTLNSGTDAWAMLSELCGGDPSRIVASDLTPSWLSMTYQFVRGTGYVLTFSGSPDQPGNYIVQYHTENYDMGIYWVINVAANTDTIYTITYNIDGGSGTTPGQERGIYGEAVVLNSGFVNGVEITKSGYNLVGWYAPNQVTVEGTYALGSVFGMYADITLTANWQATQNVIIFSMDGGSLENVNAYVVGTGEIYPLPTESDAVKNGYTLIGWRVTGDSQAAYAPGFLLEIDDTIKLEAYFYPSSSLSDLCVVTFDYGDGYGVPTTQYIESGMFVYLPRYGMENSGMYFKGWSTTPGGDVINAYSYQITGDTTLYAVWEEDGGSVSGLYTVTFNSNGGNTSVATQQVYEGGLVSQPSGVTREGYILVGWYSPTKDALWDFENDTVQGNMVLNAQWEQHFSYTVDGLTVTVTIYTGSQSGRDYAQSATINWGDGQTSTTESGYATHTYAGPNWSSRIVVTSYVNGMYYTSTLPLSGLVGDHVPETVTCTVTFYPNGGYTTEHGTSSWTVTVERYSTVSQPEDPVLDGYTFTGWYYYNTLWDFSNEVSYNITLVAGYENDEGEVIDPTDPDQPTVVYPTARIVITELSDTSWLLDGTSSTNAFTYAWYVDGEPVSTSPTYVLYDLAEGNHIVLLIVTSSTNASNSATDTIRVDSSGGGDNDDEEGDGRGTWDRLMDWLADNALVILALIVLIVIVILIARAYI